MNKQILPLLAAQFLSAFADNAILFAIIALVMQSTELPNWYVPALQSVFLIAPVLLAPWLGAFADSHAKARVLILANLVKALGAGLILFKVEALFAYGIIGVGAAIYSPAKYGILPELSGHQGLVKVNSWIEGSTILAILLGMVIGAKVADYSVPWAVAGSVVLYMASALFTLFLPVSISKKTAAKTKLLAFAIEIKQFFSSPRARFAIVSAALFWATAATLRVVIVAWAPLVLATKNASDISELTLALAVGIVAGSALVPTLIPLEHLRRARIPAYLMALFVLILSLTESNWPARFSLFFIGMMGGMFIVPVNAALQELGQQSIGSGSAVALQNFFQNLTMLVAVGCYTYAASLAVSPVTALIALSIVVFVATFLIALRLRDN
ncbi:MAG: lysophospholipid transporter LplT [Methylococcaceae bacterium]|jgi:LPLT family lysophospholipid transporter-like MFS transporter